MKISETYRSDWYNWEGLLEFFFRIFGSHPSPGTRFSAEKTWFWHCSNYETRNSGPPKALYRAAFQLKRHLSYLSAGKTLFWHCSNYETRDSWPPRALYRAAFQLKRHLSYSSYILVVRLQSHSLFIDLICIISLSRVSGWRITNEQLSSSVQNRKRRNGSDRKWKFFKLYVRITRSNEAAIWLTCYSSPTRVKKKTNQIFHMRCFQQYCSYELCPYPLSLYLMMIWCDRKWVLIHTSFESKSNISLDTNDYQL